MATKAPSMNRKQVSAYTKLTKQIGGKDRVANRSIDEQGVAQVQLVDGARYAISPEGEVTRKYSAARTGNAEMQKNRKAYDAYQKARTAKDEVGMERHRKGYTAYKRAYREYLASTRAA